MNQTQKQSPHHGKLIQLLESLPAADTFLEQLTKRNSNRKTPNSDDLRYIVPHLRTLHRIIHELLPKPNRGLWEEGLNLDPFLLTYFALMFQNVERQMAMRLEATDSKEEEGVGVGDSFSSSSTDASTTTRSDDDDDDDENYDNGDANGPEFELHLRSKL